MSKLNIDSLKNLPRKIIQSIAKHEAIKANLSSDKIIRELLRRYPEGYQIPEGIPNKPTKTVSVKVTLKTEEVPTNLGSIPTVNETSSISQAAIPQMKRSKRLREPLSEAGTTTKSTPQAPPRQPTEESGKGLNLTNAPEAAIPRPITRSSRVHAALARTEGQGRPGEADVAVPPEPDTDTQAARPLIPNSSMEVELSSIPAESSNVQPPTATSPPHNAPQSSTQAEENDDDILGASHLERRRILGYMQILVQTNELVENAVAKAEEMVALATKKIENIDGELVELQAMRCTLEEKFFGELRSYPPLYDGSHGWLARDDEERFTEEYYDEDAEASSDVEPTDENNPYMDWPAEAIVAALKELEKRGRKGDSSEEESVHTEGSEQEARGEEDEGNAEGLPPAKKPRLRMRS